MADEKSYLKAIEQGRARQAYEYAETARKKTSWKEYESGVKKLPVLIKTNGLGQALAFIKNRPQYPDIYHNVCDWLQRKDFKHLVPEHGDFLKNLISMDSDSYRQVTVETLALLNWMRRFVDGME